MGIVMGKIAFYDDQLRAICMFSPPRVPHYHYEVIRYPLYREVQPPLTPDAATAETEQVEVVEVQFFQMHHRNSHGITSYTWYGITSWPDGLKIAFNLR